MLIIPAIDILGGQCVRLTQGDYQRKKIYNANPIAVAKNFMKQGAPMLHIVDLDGAKEGKPVNRDLILRLRKAVTIPIQVGGGIRTFQTAQDYLQAGIDRIILGTRALENDFLQKLLQKFGSERIVVSLDLRNGKIATSGWQNVTNQSYLAFAKKLQGLGITQVICTDIAKDGMLGEPNFAPLERLKSIGLQVIASGGVSTVTALKKLSKMGIDGAIIGKALYEGKITIKKAINACRRDGINPVSTNQQLSLAKRIIPCMDIANGRVVKGTHFKNLKDAGDPVELGKFYAAQGADELVFLDITATVEKRKTLVDLVRRIAREIDIPFCVGGGIRTLKDIQALLEAGADKISIGSAAVTDPVFVAQAAARFGSQCIVISIDAKQIPRKVKPISRRRDDVIAPSGNWFIYTHGGRTKQPIDAIAFARDMEQRGAGELLVNSLDRDGTKQGYDLQLLRAITKAVTIPVIASSGAGEMADFYRAFKEANCSAALGASLFHYGEITIPQLKQYLIKKGVVIRLPQALIIHY